MALLYFLPAQVLRPVKFPGWDKVLHVLAYGTLATLSLRAFHGGWHRLSVWPSVLALSLTLGFGVVDEIRQSGVPGRVPSMMDLLADVVGASLALAAIGLVVVLRSRGNAALNSGAETTGDREKIGSRHEA